MNPEEADRFFEYVHTRLADVHPSTKQAPGTSIAQAPDSTALPVLPAEDTEKYVRRYTRSSTTVDPMPGGMFGVYDLYRFYTDSYFRPRRLVYGLATLIQYDQCPDIVQEDTQ